VTHILKGGHDGDRKTFEVIDSVASLLAETLECMGKTSFDARNGVFRIL
jgi:hypothetical protein